MLSKGGKIKRYGSSFIKKTLEQNFLELDKTIRRFEVSKTRMLIGYVKTTDSNTK